MVDLILLCLLAVLCSSLYAALAKGRQLQAMESALSFADARECLACHEVVPALKFCGACGRLLPATASPLHGSVFRAASPALVQALPAEAVGLDDSCPLLNPIGFVDLVNDPRISWALTALPLELHTLVVDYVAHNGQLSLPRLVALSADAPPRVSCVNDRGLHWLESTRADKSKVGDQRLCVVDGDTMYSFDDRYQSEFILSPGASSFGETERRRLSRLHVEWSLTAAHLHADGHIYLTKSGKDGVEFRRFGDDWRSRSKGPHLNRHSLMSCGTLLVVTVNEESTPSQVYFYSPTLDEWSDDCGPCRQGVRPRSAARAMGYRVLATSVDECNVAMRNCCKRAVDCCDAN